MPGSFRDPIQFVKVEWLLRWLDAARGGDASLADEVQEVVIGVGLQQEGWLAVECEESSFMAFSFDVFCRPFIPGTST